MTRSRWLCSLSAASVLFLISGACSATAQEAQGLKVLKAIGSSPFVRNEIETVFGPSAAGVLLGKSDVEIGKLAVNNDWLAARVADHLSTADKLEWAGTINSLRLSENNESLFMYRTSTGAQGLFKELAPGSTETLNLPNAAGDLTTRLEELARGGTETWKSSPAAGGVNATLSTRLSDADPRFEVPRFDLGNTHVQELIKSVPVSEVLGVSGGTAALTLCDQDCVDRLKKVLNAGVESSAPTNR